MIPSGGKQHSQFTTWNVSIAAGSAATVACKGCISMWCIGGGRLHDHAAPTGGHHLPLLLAVLPTSEAAPTPLPPALSPPRLRRARQGPGIPRVEHIACKAPANAASRCNGAAGGDTGGAGLVGSGCSCGSGSILDGASTAGGGPSTAGCSILASASKPCAEKNSAYLVCTSGAAVAQEPGNSSRDRGCGVPLARNCTKQAVQLSLLPLLRQSFKSSTRTVPPSAGSGAASRSFVHTKSCTSSFPMTSKMPSQAKRSQSPGAQPATVWTSGTAVTLHKQGAIPAGLYWKSPSARLTAKAPSTRIGPAPRGPHTTDPPAASIRFTSSSRCGLWSTEHVSLLPAHSTALESPQWASCTQYSVGCGRVMIAATTVVPLLSSGSSSSRSRASTWMKASCSSSAADCGSNVPRLASCTNRSSSMLEAA
mmetsp:Transcript_44983/g.125148  ORF Transcript_44983/g.125148 Transcript_44983/m.125148 type:complete len:423 (-) Transcript_44983:267-1535(-)